MQDFQKASDTQKKPRNLAPSSVPGRGDTRGFGGPKPKNNRSEAFGNPAPQENLFYHHVVSAYFAHSLTPEQTGRQYAFCDLATLTILSFENFSTSKHTYKTVRHIKLYFIYPRNILIPNTSNLYYYLMHSLFLLP